MLKHPGPVRALVLADVDRMAKHLHAMLTLLEVTELDALKALEQPHLEGFIVEVTNFVMAKFGHETAPKEERFDKTRRALAKQAKGLRGANTFDNSADRRRRLEAMNGHAAHEDT